MSKVYLITKNKIVCDTTLDKEIAKKLQLYYSDQWNEAIIEEWPLQTKQSIQNLNFDRQRYYTIKQYDENDLQIINEFLWNGFGVDQHVRYDNGFLKTIVMTSSKEKALILAKEKFNQFEKERKERIKRYDNATH